MIQSREDLNRYLEADRIGLRRAGKRPSPYDEVWRFHNDNNTFFVIEDADEVSISPSMLGVIVAGRELEMRVDENNNVAESNDELMYRLDNDVVRDARLWITPKHIATLRVLPSPVHVQIDGMTHDLVLEPDGSACIGDNEITPAGLRRMYDAIGGHLGLKTKPEA